ncbi:MAG: acyl-CoA desaturase [Myxococcota bacterium]
MSERVRQRQVRTAGQRGLLAFNIAAIHATAILGLAFGPERDDWILMACVYPLHVIGIGISLHRYFAHRSFRTSRGFQFFLALCSSLIFGDAVAFAGKHRIHHQRSDTPDDVHTPLHGFWSCWFGSLLDSGYTEEEVLARAKDWQRYPELMWLHRYSRVPGIALIAIAFLFGGVTAAGVGVCLPICIGIHQTSMVNYFTHRSGYQSFETGDRSTNNFWVALLSFGEGWHNNHHHHPQSARAGFRWWEIDPYYWMICAFERMGLVWDVRRPPERLLSGAPDPAVAHPG